MKSGELGQRSKFPSDGFYPERRQYGMGGIRSNWRLMTRTQKILSAATFCCLVGAPSMFATSINGDCGTELYNGVGTLVIGSNPTTCPTGTTLGLNIGTGVGQVTITGIEVWTSADYTGGTSQNNACLLYTSDAADDLLCVDLGGRRII